MIHCRFCKQGNDCRYGYMQAVHDLKPTGDSEADHKAQQAVGDMATDCGSYERKTFELQ